MKHMMLLIFSALVLSHCKAPSSEAVATDTTAVETDAAPLVSFCNWNEVGVRESAGEKGKYMTTIYLGEQIVALSDTASEISGTKRNRYRKIRLSDGKEGWVREDLIAIDVRPAALVTKSSLFKRPDFATVSDKEFIEMEFVAAKDAGNGWMQIVGKRSGDKWFSNGYVKTETLTFEETDVNFAALFKRMSESTDANVKGALMEQLANESVFGNSSFYASYFGTDTEGDSEEGYEEVEDSEGDYAGEESGTPIGVSAYLIYKDGSLSDFDVVDYNGALWNTIIGEGDAAQASERTRLVINGSGDFVLRLYKGDTVIKDELVTIDQETSLDIEDTGCEKISITLMREGNVVFQGTIPFECGE